MRALPGTVPILSCAEAQALEATLLAGDETREWAAMQRAGCGVAEALLDDAEEIGGLGEAPRILVLAGKGHNGGDALIATGEILRRYPGGRAEVIFVFGERALRPLAMRAWRELATDGGGRVAVRASLDSAAAYDICVDGVFGFQFRPPVEPRVATLIDQVNAHRFRLRAAVDLPSAGRFQADFTYATGSVKDPIVGATEAGRVRYLDLGFFKGDEPGDQRVLTPAILRPLAGLRRPQSDKWSYGHVFVVGGSRSFPGAVLMSVFSALRSGAGLVTAFVPESVVAAFAAQAPAAMWVGWPETPGGRLALGRRASAARVERATALVIGPGLGREPETMALARSLVHASRVPVVIDADALQPEIVSAGEAPRIVTPHAGEWERIERVIDSGEGSGRPQSVLVRKGPSTRVVHGGVTYHSFFGGPVLARGGSGDLLAGLIGGLLAQTPREPLLAAARRRLAWDDG